MEKPKTRASKMRAVNKYNKKAYDNVSFRVKKGGNKFVLEFAKEVGKSKAQFIRDLIIEAAQKYSPEAAIRAREALVPEAEKNSEGV